MNRRDLLAIVLLLCVLPFFFLSVEIRTVDIPKELFVLGHIGFFGLLSLVLMKRLRSGWPGFGSRAALVLLVVLVLGIAIELIQPHFGRSASVRDVWQNLVGAFLGVALSAPAGVKRRLLTGAAGLVLAMELYTPATTLWDRRVAAGQFPVISNFDTRFEHTRWSRGTRDSSVQRNGSHSLRLDLAPGRFPGTTLLRSVGDWRGHRILLISLFNPAEQPLALTIAIHDHAHAGRGGAYADRYNGEFLLEQGWNDLRIPIRDIRDAPLERQLDLGELSHVMLFTVDLEEHRTLYLDQVRLVR